MRCGLYIYLLLFSVTCFAQADTLYETDSLTNLKQSTKWHNNGIPFFMIYKNYNTGRMEEVERDDSGKIIATYELATDSFDAERTYYYPNGKIEENGFTRQVNILDIRGRDSVMLSSKTESRLGRWSYYYPNGCDSATGNYAAVAFEQDSVFPTEPGEFIMIGIMFISDIKDGTWKYFSPEGRLLYTEEWRRGKLTGRKESQ